MTLGIEGTGPHGRIRTLRRYIADYKYELYLIDQGFRRAIGKKRLNQLIAEHQAEIKKILKKEKSKK